MNYEIQEALGQIAREKNVDPELVRETLQVGLVQAVKKKYGPNTTVDVTLDPKSGRISVARRLSIVEEITDPQIEITLEDARRYDDRAVVGSDLVIPLPIEQFGRNAIQAAKQVVIQRVREAERDRVYREYQDRVGELVRGTVQQVDRGNVIVKLERSEAILPVREQISRDHYRPGDYIRAYVSGVERSTKGPQVTLSRTHPEFLVKLFESEVPEIADGVVQIKAVAREPGTRSKIAVHSNDDRIDPVGACVGIKGARVQAVVRELSGERIDIVPWSADVVVFARRALSPAKVLDTMMLESEGKLIVHVADDQLSLAIGKAGQNARLAAKLTGWMIDLVAKSDTDRAAADERERAIDLETLPEVGEALASRLAREGIETAVDVQRAGIDGLTAIAGIGDKVAAKLLAIADEALAGAETEGDTTAAATAAAPSPDAEGTDTDTTHDDGAPATHDAPLPAADDTSGEEAGKEGVAP